MVFVWAQYFVSQGTFKEFIIASFSFNSKVVLHSRLGPTFTGLIIFIGILVLVIGLFVPFLIRAIKSFGSPCASYHSLPIVAVSVILFMLLLATGLPTTILWHYHVLVVSFRHHNHCKL